MSRSNSPCTIQKECVNIPFLMLLVKTYYERLQKHLVKRYFAFQKWAFPAVSGEQFKHFKTKIIADQTIHIINEDL